MLPGAPAVLPNPPGRGMLCGEKLEHAANAAEKGTHLAMLDADVKQRIIAEYSTHERDTGSAELQVAMLTERIRQVTDHLRTHRKDVHSRRGLVTMVSKRRRLLNYLSRTDVARYQNLIARLGLRR